MAEIFISYRRTDTSGHATSIYERLEETFGSSEAFLDTARMEAGSRWQEETRAQLEACELCVVVIGRQWAPERLGDREDLVRLELETALNGNKALIPVLVDNAELPRANELPRSLRSLLSWQAVWLDHRSYGAYKQDLDTLVDRIRELFMQRGLYGVIRVYCDPKEGLVSRPLNWLVYGFHPPNISILVDGSLVAEIGLLGEILEFQIPVGPHAVQAMVGNLRSEPVAYRIQREDFKCLHCYHISGYEGNPPESVNLVDALPLLQPGARPGWWARWHPQSQTFRGTGSDYDWGRQCCFEKPPTKRLLVQSGTRSQ